MRLAPRSTWAIAVVPDSRAAAKPATSAVSPDSLVALVDPWRRASVRMPPTAPGAIALIVSCTTRRKLSWSSAVAKPTTAISAGRIVSVI
jgi:hypothetical protein